MTRFHVRPSLVSLALLWLPAFAACGSDTKGVPVDTHVATDTVLQPETTVTTDTVVPPDSLPDKETTVVEETTPVDTTPADTTPPDTTPGDTTPVDTTVTETVATDTVVHETTTEVTAACGNGVLEAGELCDKTALGSATCATLGLDAAGALACNTTCDGYDLSGCLPLCGNGTLDAGEKCDGTTIVNDATCADLGYASGTLGCQPTCLGLDVSGCTTTEVCGNNTVAGPEACDGSDLGVDSFGDPMSCEAFGFAAGGTLHCRADCMNWDVSGCGAATVPGWTCPASYYGDGSCDCGCGVPDSDCGAAVTACEYCNDPGSCAKNPGCGEISAANTGVCNGTVVACGNGTAGPGESCDGSDLRGASCASLGFVGGTLACADNCSFDTTACDHATVPTGWTCPDSYYGDGDCDCGCGAQDSDCASTTDLTECAYCTACAGFGDCSVLVDPTDTTACEPAAPSDCGNALIEGREECDGTNLGTATCASLGYEGGTLACAADCSFDRRGCTITVPAGWTCDVTAFGDGVCDCGCGVKDFDCAGTSDVTECGACATCDGTGDCAGRVDNADTTQCGGAVAGWTCPTAWFGDGDCDCGCGVQDRDCAGTTDVTECAYCSACGGAVDCATIVDTADTTQCVGGAVPGGWTCAPEWYADGSCDCGCGVQDFDCTGTTDVSECAYCSACGDTSGGCATVVDAANTTACVATTCGDRVASGGESCDGSDLAGASCASLGFTGGTLACTADCTFDTSGCTRPEVPAGWVCARSDYGNGVCDCGCGAQDLDCASTTEIRDCAACTNCPGAGDCTARVDNSDTTACSAVVVVPDGWTCDKTWYADGTCDCGCGIQDFDCTVTDDVSECVYCASCPGTGDCTTRVDDTNTTACLNPVPAGWTCSEAYYGDGTCDCGCGAQDLDCASTTDVAACAYCESCGVTAGGSCAGAVDASNTTACVAGAVPVGWTCDAAWYGDGSCDCGCGVKDYDCAGTTDANECTYCLACPSGASATDCTGVVDGADTTRCAPPAGWTCNPSWYADGTCDCGCGAQDSDCAGTTDATECVYCDACDDGTGAACTTLVNTADTTVCKGVVPAGWTCSADFYGDGSCDCGCGVQDADCVSTSDVTACAFCDSCLTSASDTCATMVDATDTRLCTNAAPAGWTCDPSYYSDGSCDCGCGIQDSDCAGTSDATECTYCMACGATGADSCVDFVDPRETTRCYSACGNGVIDPGEQCEKTDLGGATCAGLGFVSGELGCSATCGFDTSLCVVPPLPVAWTCDASWFGDGSCDCGCGAKDVDCFGADDVTQCAFCASCAGSGDCTGRVDHADTTLCLPDGWRCNPSYFDDAACDCGCGAQDADCATTTTVAECDFCDQCGARFDEACSGFVDATDTTMCLAECGNGVVDAGEACDGAELAGETCATLGFAGGTLACSSACGFDTSGCLPAFAPASWTCAQTWYADGSCDCGCGAQDPDCTGTSDVSECLYCTDCPGTGNCASRVDARDTTLCAPAALVPLGWACPESYYGDGSCDCGCGAQDSDCSSTTDASECAYCDACGVALGDACGAAVDATNTTMCQ